MTLAQAAYLTAATIPAYDFKIKDLSRGVALWYYGDYQPAGADPVAGWLPGGAIEDGGITFTDKPTIAAVNIDQMYREIAAYTSKRDSSFKLVTSHIAPEVYNLAHGYPPASLVITPGTPTEFGTKVQKLGEPGTVGVGGDLATGAGDTPTSEQFYFQTLFLFPSPGFNFSTTPTAKWGGVRFYKCYATDASDTVTVKGKSSTIGFTVKALSDLSVTEGLSKAGIRGSFSVKIP